MRIGVEGTVAPYGPSFIERTTTCHQPAVHVQQDMKIKQT